MRKHYINSRTGEDTASAAQAMNWHRSGDAVQVNTFYNEPHKTGLANVVRVPGAIQEKKSRLDENTAHCKRIARNVDAYASGDVCKCPECGESIYRDDWNYVGDVFRCPECGHVDNLNNFEEETIWDYLNDVYNVEFRVDCNKELRSVQIMVACGGPNIYLDTASRDVELYWWNERARWPMSSDAVQALDDWAEEYWGCL